MKFSQLFTLSYLTTLFDVRKIRLFVSFTGLIGYLRILRFLLPENKPIHSIVFLFSSFVALNLFIFEYNELAILFYCVVWFFNAQYSTTDKNKLVDEILNNPIKRKAYQDEIMKIVQSRYLLTNDSINNYQWLNYLIKTRWAQFIRKLFQHEINQIAYSCFVDEKYSLKDHENAFRGWTKSNEILINKNLYRFDSLILKEAKSPVIHEVKEGCCLRKDEIMFQLRVQFWIDIIIHDVGKEEKIVIENLEFLGTARLILLPLLNKYPFVGGFTFFFRKKLIFCTNADLKLLDLKDSQSNVLKEFIDQKINQILYNLNYKIQARFISEEITFNKSVFHAPILLCYLNIIEIINLDSSNLSSNYTYFCLVKFDDYIYTTRSIKNTVSPKFNDTFLFPVHDLYQSIVIKLFARKQEYENSICIGKLKINLPAKGENINDLDSYLKNLFKTNLTFTGKSIWLPLRVENQSNRLPFINLKIALMNLSADCSKFLDHTLIQFSRNQPNQLPVLFVNVPLNNINLEYLINKQLIPGKLNREHIIRVFANFYGNYQFGKHFFVQSNATISSIRNVKFFFIANSSMQSPVSDLNFEIELLNPNGIKEIVPGKVTVKISDLMMNKKSNLMKNITFQSLRTNKTNPATYGTAELHLTVQTVLIDDSVLENLPTIANKTDELTDCLRPQNINSISYFSSYSEKLKQMKLDKELDELIPDLQFKTKKIKKLRKLKRDSSKQSKIVFTEVGEQREEQKDEDKKEDCEIMLVFHYPSNQLLLVDVIRLINVPVFARNTLPNPTLLIEMWKDKSRVAYSLTETKYQTRDPFYSIQVQFEISANKLSNLFLRILILENAKKTVISKEKSHFLAELFIKIPELKIGNSSEPKWYKFNRIGLY